MEFSCSNEFEIPYIEIFSLMRNNIYNYHRDINSIKIDKTYIAKRKSLIALIYKISNRMNFKSKTFYLAVNYLDIIFSKQKDISYNYNLIAAACLITAFKFCENVPLKPTFKRFIYIFNEEMNSTDFIITKDDLFLYEIIICKMLDYKLNYFTAYDFNFFFFGNGILKSEHLKEINNSIEIGNTLIKNLLIKIYEKSKYYLNIIINNLICLKYDSLLISICIMEKSIDYILIKEFNREDSFNIDEIKRKNKKYFWEIMKDIYKIEYESLQDYQYLKIDCEKYKIFEDNFKVNEFDLNKSQNLLFNKNLDTNKASSKNITNNKTKEEDEESIQNKKYNKKKNILYKKVNISCLENKKNMNENNMTIKRNAKGSPEIEQDNKKNSNIINTNSKRTLYEFYQNNHFRNSVSNKKDYYFLKKSNTSSSQFKNFFNKKTKLKESNNINNIKRIDSPDSNSNSFDEMKEINNNILIKNKNVNITKPYKKKIIYNHDKTQNRINNNKNTDKNITNNTNNNININININNRILYEEISKSKYRGRSTNKIIISKYVDDNDNSSNTKGRNINFKSKAKMINNYPEYNFESSPIYKRNISKSKNNITFKKNRNNDESVNKLNINSSNNKEEDKNKKTLKYKINKLTDIKYNDIPNSSLTSRNSFQFPKHDIKLTDSFVNIQMNYFKNDININNRNSQNNNIIKNIDNYESLNKKNEKNNIKNNINSESNSVNNNFNKYQNHINNNFNINFNYINEKI